MEHIDRDERNPLLQRLAGEVADVQASVEMVAAGIAESMTLSGLRFSRQLVARLGPAAAERGVALEATFWPDDDLADVHVTRAAGPAAAIESERPTEPERV
jgi:hypothetical protein